MSTTTLQWTLSVVSHGHDLRPLVDGLSRILTDPASTELVVTWNLGPREAQSLDWAGPLVNRHNPRPKGFAANHNAALHGASGQYLAMIDPDLVFRSDPFPSLATLLQDPACGFASPAVLDQNGQLSDHARDLPSPRAIVGRRIRRQPSQVVMASAGFRDVDWIAGLFMACRQSDFLSLGGFDERYYMYCEDVDLCLRSWNQNLAVRVLSECSVSHHARRQTLKNPRHFLWHCRSLLRLWQSDAYKTFVSRRRFKLQSG